MLALRKAGLWKVWVAVLGITLAGTVILMRAPFAMSAEPKTLCQASEKVMFSCSVGSSILSVCSSQPDFAAAGPLTYRFGKAQGKVELEYPASAQDATKSFRFSWAGGGHWADRQLSFSNAGYVYTVWSFGDGLRPREASSGVAVSQNGKIVSVRSCAAGRPDVDKLYMFQDSPLPEAPYLDIPSPKRK
jgi:hypothetical protein